MQTLDIKSVENCDDSFKSDTDLHRVRKTFCVQVVIITAHSHRDLYYLVFLSCWLFLAQEHNLERTSNKCDMGLCLLVYLLVYLVDVDVYEYMHHSGQCVGTGFLLLVRASTSTPIL